MKLAFLILTIFNLSSFGSCLLKIDNKGSAYCFTSWKHVEGRDDTVEAKDYSAKELSPIHGILSQHKGLKIIFNEGVFTSMKYIDGDVKRWANMSKAEKDMIFYIQEKINVIE